MDEIITQELFVLILECSKEMKVKPVVKRPHKPKSRKIDEKMQLILQELIVDELACILSSTGLSQSTKISDDLMGTLILESSSLLMNFSDTI